MTISKQTAMDIALAHREIETAELAMAKAQADYERHVLDTIETGTPA